MWLNKEKTNNFFETRFLTGHHSCWVQCLSRLNVLIVLSNLHSLILLDLILQVRFYSHFEGFFSAAAQGVDRRAQTSHRQAAEDRAAAGRAQPPGGGDGDAALHRGREALPGHQRGGQRSRRSAGRGSVPVCTGTDKSILQLQDSLMSPFTKNKRVKGRRY